MNSGSTSVRIYEALRARLRQRGFRPGERLDPAVLADELGSSSTPVRDALHILVGEGLVTTRTGGGFATAMIDEPGLIDLYAWSGEVLRLALARARSPLLSTSTAMHGAESGDLAERTAALFQQIADHSGNIEHSRATEHTSARLHGARLIEPLFLPDVEQELSLIAGCTDPWDASNLRQLLARYTRRRQAIAAAIVRQLYRDEG